jgi:hypothetical protein
LKQTRAGYEIAEGISGMWHYHIRERGKMEAACGLDASLVMPTQLPLSSWGFKPGHMPTSYCSKCDVILSRLS